MKRNYPCSSYTSLQLETDSENSLFIFEDYRVIIKSLLLFDNYNGLNYVVNIYALIIKASLKLIL